MSLPYKFYNRKKIAPGQPNEGNILLRFYSPYVYYSIEWHLPFSVDNMLFNLSRNSATMLDPPTEQLNGR